MSTNSETILPREQWEQILVNVPPADLCKVMLTSNYMYDMASWPKLWTQTKVNIRKVKKDGLAQLYTINRFKYVKKIDFNGISLTREELERVLRELPGIPLEHLDLSDVNLSQVSSALLATAVSSLKTVNLSSTDLTTDQCIHLLEACASSTTLTKLNLQRVNLCDVPTELLTRTVSNLDVTNIWGAQVTADQFVSALETSESCNKVVKVHPAGINLPELPPEQSVKVLSVMMKGWRPGGQSPFTFPTI